MLPKTPEGLYTGPIRGEPYWPGVDVSQYQRPGKIDWVAAREAGIRWVMVRATYGRAADPAAAAHVRAIRAAGLLVGLYGFPTESPVDALWNTFKAQADACGLGPDDIAPAWDLEPLDGCYHLPSDIPGYLATTQELRSRAREEWGQSWLYTYTGFWSLMGKPLEWLDQDWWEAFPESLLRRLPGQPSEPDEAPVKWAAWQKGTITVPWCKCGPIDSNVAKFLPLVLR